MITELTGGPKDGLRAEIADGTIELRIPVPPTIPLPPEDPADVPAWSAAMPSHFRELVYRRARDGRFVFAGER